ncbi:amidase [Vibrio sp.]|uniref:amidase n=1 Tax=Vibrio sp. TaxID=678 RepID=UPI00311E0794
MMLDLDSLTIREMVDCQKKGLLKSITIIEHYLRRYDQFNPTLNAIVEQAPLSTLLASAENADIDIQQGDVQGELHGIPITVKDAMHAQGFRPSRGVKELYGAKSDKDATVLSRLKKQGAIPLGLTNVPEMCMSFDTHNPLYGRTLNPHNVSFSCGGSSGGEASAIASGMSPGGLASDACGSVRIPAHFNGICGFKLTQGRVPLTGQFPRDRSGLFHLTSSFGVMGRYVDDVDLLASFIHGGDGQDPDTVTVPYQDYRQCDIQGLKVGVWRGEDTGVTLCPDIDKALSKVEAILARNVSSVEPIIPPLISEACDVIWKLFVLGGDGGRGWQALYQQMSKSEFTPEIAAILEQSKNLEMTADEIKGAMITRDTFRHQLSLMFNQVDVLISPVYPDVAFKNGTSMERIGNYAFVFPFSLSGSPAIVIPVSRCSDTGMPIGIQIVGKHWSEHQILAVASALEASLQYPLFEQKPLI